MDGPQASGTANVLVEPGCIPGQTLSAFQGQAVGTQIFAHPEKLPHTLQLAEVLVLRRQETGIQDKPCCAMGSSGRGSPC